MCVCIYVGVGVYVFVFLDYQKRCWGGEVGGRRCGCVGVCVCERERERAKIVYNVQGQVIKKGVM